MDHLERTLLGRVLKLSFSSPLYTVRTPLVSSGVGGGCEGGVGGGGEGGVREGQRSIT